MNEETKIFGVGCGMWIAGIILIAILSAGGYWIDRTFYYPQVRANTVQNPDRSISNRALFHDELRAILAADQNTQMMNARIATFKQDNHKPYDTVTEQSYSDLQAEFAGLQQIRQGDIAAYNSASNDPDIGRDRDAWLPKQLDATETTTINSIFKED